MNIPLDKKININNKNFNDDYKNLIMNIIKKYNTMKNILEKIDLSLTLDLSFELYNIFFNNLNDEFLKLKKNYNDTLEILNKNYNDTLEILNKNYNDTLEILNKNKIFINIKNLYLTLKDINILYNKKIKKLEEIINIKEKFILNINKNNSNKYYNIKQSKNNENLITNYLNNIKQSKNNEYLIIKNYLNDFNQSNKEFNELYEKILSNYKKFNIFKKNKNYNNNNNFKIINQYNQYYIQSINDDDNSKKIIFNKYQIEFLVYFMTEIVKNIKINNKKINFYEFKYSLNVIGKGGYGIVIGFISNNVEYCFKIQKCNNYLCSNEYYNKYKKFIDTTKELNINDIFNFSLLDVFYNNKIIINIYDDNISIDNIDIINKYNNNNILNSIKISLFYKGYNFIDYYNKSNNNDKFKIIKGMIVLYTKFKNIYNSKKSIHFTDIKLENMIIFIKDNKYKIKIIDIEEIKIEDKFTYNTNYINNKYSITPTSYLNSIGYNKYFDLQEIINNIEFINNNIINNSTYLYGIITIIISINILFNIKYKIHYNNNVITLTFEIPNERYIVYMNNKIYIYFIINYIYNYINNLNIFDINDINDINSILEMNLLYILYIINIWFTYNIKSDNNVSNIKSNNNVSNNNVSNNKFNYIDINNEFKHIEINNNNDLITIFNKIKEYIDKKII